MQTNEPPAGAPALRIDVVSDVVCPWCWIGKGQLDRAIEQWRTCHPDRNAPRVAWHPFQLNPDLPAEGLPRGEYLDAKFGSRNAYPAERIESAWTGETLQATRTADAQARRAGIGGVPFFVVGERFGVSGAQGIDALLDAFEQAAAV